MKAYPHPILRQDDRGFVLPIGLMFLGILVILGITAIILSTTDLKTGENYKASVMAFQDAQAGANFAVQSMENGLKDGTFALPTHIGDTVSLAGFIVPGDFSFQLGAVTKTADNAYSFSSTGSRNDASAAILTTAKKGSAINYAAFGNLLVDMKASSSVYSYDSSSTPSPTPGDSTGEGDVGSNGSVSVKMGTTIDGSVALGDDGATPPNEAAYTSTGTPVITGTTGADVDRVDPDPLGIIGGTYADMMTAYSTNNNNSDVGVPQSLDLRGNLTLSAGNYYFTGILLRNGATLNIDASAGQVNIWLVGGMVASNGSSLNLTGRPTDFSIFSNSTEKIILEHGSHHRGLVYAPYATVEMKNDGNLYGAVWAETADMKNAATVYYDVSLRDEYQSNKIVVTGWQEQLD